MAKDQTRIVFVLTVFVMSVLYSASAKSLVEWDTDARERYNNAKNEYLRVSNAYREAMQDWITAKNAYQQNKSKGNTENALESWKNHLLAADQRLVAYLEALKAYAEGEPTLDETERQEIISEVEGYINWLEQKQPEIEAATTRQELQDITTTVREEWNSIKPATRRIIGQMMNAKVLWVINKAENVSAKAEEAIDKLDAAGEDTTELESLLADFNAKLDLAREKHDAASAKYAESRNAGEVDSLLREADALVREANGYLKEAYTTLKQLVKEIRESASGKVRVRGTGKLWAAGDGEATISGNATVELTGEDGELELHDKGGDMIETVTGFGDRRVTGQIIRYSGSGTATVSGSDIVVKLEASNVDLYAEGTGKAKLKGTGTYKTCGTGACAEGAWTSAGVDVTISANVG
ncbi:MAG: hypothetical protein V1921_02595 [Candidatus Altiarchaeota archaeon]